MSAYISQLLFNFPSAMQREASLALTERLPAFANLSVVSGMLSAGAAGARGDLRMSSS